MGRGWWEEVEGKEWRGGGKGVEGLEGRSGGGGGRGVCMGGGGAGRKEWRKRDFWNATRVGRGREYEVSISIIT